MDYFLFFPSKSPHRLVSMPIVVIQDLLSPVYYRSVMGVLGTISLLNEIGLDPEAVCTRMTIKIF